MMKLACSSLTKLIHKLVIDIILEQFKKLDIIVYLKLMGVPLKEIKRKMEHSSLDEFIETLAEYQQVTKEKIRHLQRVNAQLITRMKELEQTRHINQKWSSVYKTPSFS